MNWGRVVTIISCLTVLLLLESLFYNYRHQPVNTAVSAEPSLPKDCSNGRPAHPDLATSNEPSLAKLAEYESVCRGNVVDQLMLFAAMPSTPEEAGQLAQHTASQLQAFATANISPLVVFEPSLSDPSVLKTIQTGAYDDALKAYFAALKNAGITDQQMGTWVLFPEANTPLWDTTSPSLFTQNVTKIAHIQKDVFPGSKASIMLNSRTYPSDDTSWNHGELKDLSPYVASLPKGLIDSFGYQGFPFLSPANSPDHIEQLKTADFLPRRLAISAAKQLGVHDIWFNTGTFARRYTDDPATEVTLSPAQRQTILDDILAEAKATKEAGFSLSVNLFAADKSTDSEHTDWSYWQPGQMASSKGAAMFDTFVRKLRQSSIDFSLYDYKP